MSRVLFWNLQTFGINKINDPVARIKRGRNGRALKSNIGGNTPQVASWQRRTLVESILAAANADIVVLVEVASGDSSPNDLATFTGGMEGAEYLLGRLRTANPAAGWRLVPPLRVGLRDGSKPETVAVFFKGLMGGGAQRYFTGPNRWSGGPNGLSRPAPALGNAYGAVPLDLNGMLVPPAAAPPPPAVSRVVPAGGGGAAGAQYNGGQPENTLAARVTFDLLNAPGYRVDYGVFRPPYMVTFSETNAANVVVRNLTLFGIHSPATAGDPNIYITYLTQTADVVAPLGPNETRVLGGDFNLNLMDVNGAPSNVYAPLAPYVPLLQSAGAPPAPLLSTYKGFFATHILPAPAPNEGNLFLWSAPPNNSPYPGYGYYGSDFFPNFYSIDNILVWPYIPPPPPPPPVVPGHNYQMSIINPIAGSPFNLIVGPPNTQPGSVVLTNQMRRIVAAIPPVAPWPQVPNAAQLALAYRKNMLAWDNYGYQRNTSDHFAIFAVV
jgi:hypothetical protein